MFSQVTLLTISTTYEPTFSTHGDKKIPSVMSGGTVNQYVKFNYI